jgi:hypothetical protein
MSTVSRMSFLETNWKIVEGLMKTSFEIETVIVNCCCLHCCCRLFYFLNRQKIGLVHDLTRVSFKSMFSVRGYSLLCMWLVFVFYPLFRVSVFCCSASELK